MYVFDKSKRANTQSRDPWGLSPLFKKYELFGRSSADYSAPLNSTAYVDSKRGSDVTAVIGLESKPYKTVDQAVSDLVNFATGSVKRLTVLEGSHTLTKSISFNVLIYLHNDTLLDASSLQALCDIAPTNTTALSEFSNTLSTGHLLLVGGEGSLRCQSLQHAKNGVSSYTNVQAKALQCSNTLVDSTLVTTASTKSMVDISSPVVALGSVQDSLNFSVVVAVSAENSCTVSQLNLTNSTESSLSVLAREIVIGQSTVVNIKLLRLQSTLLQFGSADLTSATVQITSNNKDDSLQSVNVECYGSIQLTDLSIVGSTKWTVAQDFTYIRTSALSPSRATLLDINALSVAGAVSLQGAGDLHCRGEIWNNQNTTVTAQSGKTEMDIKHCTFSSLALNIQSTAEVHLSGQVWSGQVTYLGSSATSLLILNIVRLGQLGAGVLTIAQSGQGSIIARNTTFENSQTDATVGQLTAPIVVQGTAGSNQTFLQAVFCMFDFKTPSIVNEGIGSSFTPSSSPSLADAIYDISFFAKKPFIQAVNYHSLPTSSFQGMNLVYQP